MNGWNLHRASAASPQQSGGYVALAHRNSRLSADLVFCLVTVALGATYIGHFAWQQWLPWDDGTMAQAAERVLRGQLPHQDFNELYTGGLTQLHAAAFR